jgi:hypothetical protein
MSQKDHCFEGYTSGREPGVPAILGGAKFAQMPGIDGQKCFCHGGLALTRRLAVDKTRPHNGRR